MARATLCTWNVGRNWPRWSEIADFRSEGAHTPKLPSWFSGWGGPPGKGEGRGKERERKEREGRRGSKEERNEGGEGDAPNLRTVPTPLITATSLCLLQFPGAVVICPQISLVGNRRFINQISREATRTLIPSLTGTQAQG